MNVHLPDQHSIFRSVLSGLLLALLLCILPFPVKADIGPKPNSSFTFIWEMEEQPTIVEGTLLQCKDSECTDSHALEELGPQHFTCSDIACDSMAYGYTQYAKLVVTFSDGEMRESNIFGKKYDESQYEVTVRTSDLTVTEKRGTNHVFTDYDSGGKLLRLLEFAAGLIALTILFAVCVIFILKTKQNTLVYEDAKILCLSVWIIALPAIILGMIFAPTLPLTVLIEGILISLYTLIKKHKWFPWMTVIILGNLFTQTLYLVALNITGTWGMPFLLTIFLEIVIWLLEAILIHLTLRRDKAIRASLGISFILNVISLTIGLMLSI